jgi:cupin fold WbuC family metalloprotein
MAHEITNFIKESDEVYRTAGDITKVSSREIAFLKSVAALNERKRVRLCAHPDSSDRIHEMLIVHAKAAYVPPHKHINKSESFHIIEGLLKVFLFDEDGVVVDTIEMGEPISGRPFFYRLSSFRYHSVLPESEFVVFHEVTNGPFDRKDMVIAPWAPAEDDLEGQNKFLMSLRGKASP